jgi:hypothetical protein
MDPTRRLDPADVRSAIIDFVGVPVVLFWALLSLGPFVGLVRIADPFNYGLNFVFLLGGFWGLLTLALVLRFVMVRGVVLEIRKGAIRLPLAIFGAAWSIAYMLFLRILL